MKKKFKRCDLRPKLHLLVGTSAQHQDMVAAGTEYDL